MYRWCAYCQKFLGEVEPKDDYQMSHGICKHCRTEFDQDNELAVKQGRLLKDFFTSVRNDLLLRQNRDAHKLLRQAQELKIANFDLLLGFVQPLLYEIAQLQNAGEAFVCHEHDFSQLVEGLLSEIRKERVNSSSAINSAKSDVLLACADGNYHAFGIRFIEEFLYEEGINATTLFPSMPLGELVSIAEKSSAKIIGISVSTCDQMKMITESWNESLPHLIVGGLGVHKFQALAKNMSVYTGDLAEFRNLVQSLLPREVLGKASGIKNR